MKAFWYKSNNFGDQLTPDVLEFVLGEKVELADRNESGKLMGIGSIMTAVRNNDVIWGSGAIRNAMIRKPDGAIFLAVRGPLTWIALGGGIPQTFGDPALLLPLIYKPSIEKKHKVGILPHYIDKDVKFEMKGYIIDILKPWREVVDEILSCEMVITSSLHGIIACEAYGIPVLWARFSDRIIGGQFKFQDYFLGTGREKQQYLKEIPPIENLKKRQDFLIEVLKKHYGK